MGSLVASGPSIVRSKMNLVSLARELDAIAQTGLHFSKDPYDKERYERLRTIAAELLAVQSDLSCDEILAWSKEEFGYATPKVDVRAFIQQQNKVLLIREDADDGLWTLPGGWADVNESPSESIVREAEEESGYIIKPIRLLAVFDRERQGHTPPFPYHVYKMFFHCEIVGGSPRRTSESSESAFFNEAELPKLSQSRVLPHQIQAFFRAIREGNIATEYD
jgi:ADP-ribose pyrophosphatase YjhB (NUDIX family)